MTNSLLNDGKFIDRLRAGTNISIGTFEKARAFIRDYKPRDKSSRVDAGEAAA